MEQLGSIIDLQGELIFSLRTEMITLERGPEDLAEDLTPAAKKACIDEFVKKILDVRKEIKVAVKEEAAKNKEVHQSFTQPPLQQ